MQTPAVQQNNWFANIIGVILVGFLCWATGYLMVKIVGQSMDHDLPKEVSNIVYIILGFLTAKLSTVVDWSFGGSSATKRQGEIIAQQATTTAKLVDAATPDTTTTTTRTNTAPPAVVPAAADQPAIKPLVRPIEVTQEEWDAMNDAEKGAAVLKYSKP